MCSVAKSGRLSCSGGPSSNDNVPGTFKMGASAMATGEDVTVSAGPDLEAHAPSLSMRTHLCACLHLQCAIKMGHLGCWGTPWYNQTTIPGQFTSGVVAVSVGSTHVCALRK